MKVHHGNDAFIKKIQHFERSLSTGGEIAAAAVPTETVRNLRLDPEETALAQNHSRYGNVAEPGDRYIGQLI